MMTFRDESLSRRRGSGKSLDRRVSSIKLWIYHVVGYLTNDQRSSPTTPAFAPIALSPIRTTISPVVLELCL